MKSFAQSFKELKDSVLLSSKSSLDKISSLFEDMWTYWTLTNDYLFDTVNAIRSAETSSKNGLEDVRKAVAKIKLDPKITVKPANVSFPDTMSVSRPDWIDELLPKEKEEIEKVTIENEKPIDVRITNAHEFPVGNGSVKYMGGGSPSQLKDASGNIVNPAVIGLQNVYALYKAQDTDEASTPKYYGFAKQNGSWYILRDNGTSTAKELRYAVGTSDYATAWTGRAALTYAYIYEVTIG